MANGIRINLDTASKSQLISEVERLKNQLESKNISLKINDNNIKNQIESMRVILDSLSNNTKPIDIKFDSVKAKEELSKIQGSFENIISEYSKLGNIKVTQNFDDQGQLESFVVKLEQVNGLIRQLKYGNSGEGLFTFLSGTEKNNINEVVNSLEQFKTKYQGVLREIKETKLIDENTINKTQQKLDSLNLNNFKKISEEIKVDFANLNNVFKNALKIDDFKRQYNKKIFDFESISKYVSPEQVNNLKQQLNNLTGIESFTDIQKIKDGYDDLVKSEKVYTKQIQQNAKEAREAINNQIENYRLLESQIQKINNIKNQYSTKLDLGSKQYKELDTIYNGLINKLNKYKELGQSLNVIEVDNLKKEINGLKDKAKSIENVTNIIKQQENAIDSLKSKFGNSLSDDLVKEYKNTLQNLYTSPNLAGDTNDLKKWLNQIEKASAEVQRLKTLGKNIGSFSDNGLNMGSSLKDLRKYIREVDGYKASITSIDETTDKFGNNIKTVNYAVNEGHNIVRRYKVVLDESTNSIYKQSNGLQDLSSKHASFREKLQNSISAFLRFQVVAAGVMGAINQIKDGINTVNDLNKSETTISMVMDVSAQEAENIKKQMSDLATQYHSTTKEMMTGAEEYIRAGNDIEQSKNLLKATTIGATLSGQDTKTVTEQLIAISNGFKMNTKDAKEMMGVIDQLTFADNKSASSFAEIATAMQESSNMAQSVKVDFSHLLSYISTVSEVTRKNASSVGNSFAAQFARFQNVKGGEDFDAYSGEDISNVNRDLKTYAGIDIRSDMETFKSYETVIDELSKKWGDLDEVGRAAIAKAMAGTTHAEEFQVLMNNMDKVNGMYDDLQTKSEGSAMKAWKKWLEQNEAKIKDFQQALSKLFESTINSNVIKSAVVTMTNLVNTLTILTTTAKWSGVALLGLVTGIILLIKNFKALRALNVVTLFKNLSGAISSSNIIRYFKLLPEAMLETKGVTALLSMAFKDLALSIKGVTVALLTNPVTWIIAALGLATYAVYKHTQRLAEMKAKTDELKASYEGLTQAMKDNSAEELKSSLEPFNKQLNELKTLTEKQKKAKKELDEAREEYGKNPREANYSKLALVEGNYNEITQDIADLNKELKDAGVSTDKVTEAQNRLKNIEMLQKYEDEASAQKEKNDAIIDEINEYQELNSKEEKNATTKERMSQLSESLSKSIKGLVITRDSEGNAIITNTGLLDSNIKMLKEETETAETNAKVKMEKAKDNMIWQENETTVTYAEIRKRMQMYQIEADKYREIVAQGGNLTKDGGLTKEEAAQRAGGNDVQAALENSKLKKLDDVFNSVMKTTNAENGLSTETDYNTKKTEENTKAQEKQERTINAVREALEQYEYQLKVIDNLLQKQENYIDSLAKGSQKRRDAMLEEISLLKEQIGIYGDATSTAEKYSNSLSTISGIGGSGLAKQVVVEAEKYLGTPYVWGGESPQSGFDCSGLVQYVYSRVGVELNRTSQEQFKQGTPVQKSQLQPGDLVFFKSSGTSSEPGHVGIYAGEGKYVQAPKTGDVIKVSDLSARSDYVGARRILSGTSSSTSDSTVDSLIAQNVTYADIIKKASETFGVATNLIAGVIQQESGWDTNSISSAGAKGLMQLMPENISELGITNAFDPYQNIMGGTKHLADMIKQTGSTELGLAAYNAGLGNVQKYGGIPPFAETQNYIPKVLGYASQYSSGKLEIPDTEVLDALSASQEFQNNILNYENSIESKEQKIKEIYKNIYEDNITQFDNEIKKYDDKIQQLEVQNKIEKKNNANSIENLKQVRNYNYDKIKILQKEKEYIDEQIKNSDQLYDEATIQEMQKKSVELTTSILESNEAIKESINNWIDGVVNNIEAKFKDTFDMIDNELSRLENQSTVDLSIKLSLENQKVEETKQKINEITEAIKELNDYQYTSGDTTSSEKIKELNSNLDELKTTLSELEKNVIDTKSSISELANTVTDKIKQVIQKNNEIYKEELEKNKKLFTDAIDDEIEKLDEAQKKLQNNETNQENISNVVELQKQLNALDLRNDDEAKAKKSEIQKELDEANKKLREDTQNQNIEARKDALNKAKSDYEKLVESYNASIDASNTDEVVNKQASQALINGYLVNSEGNKIDLETALLNFEDRFGEGLTAIGNKIKTELIDQLKEVKNLLNEFGTLDATKINTSNNIKTVYGKNVDLENAKAILGTDGYKYVDTDLVSPTDLAPKKGDISLGGAIPSNLLNGATNLTGADRYKTEQMIQMYADSTNGKYSTVPEYNENTLNEYIKQKSNDKGTVYASGTDLENAKKYLSNFGYSFIDTTDVSKMNLTSNDVVVGGVGVMNGISEALEANATWLWGMNRTETEQDIISYAKKLTNYPINTKGFADGGIADFTGFTMVHGSKSRPETVLNYEQGENLHNFLTDIPSLSKNVMEQVYNRFAGIGKFNPLKLQMDTGDGGVVNNSVNFNVDKMQGTTEEARSFANKAMNFIRKQG